MDTNTSLSPCDDSNSDRYISHVDLLSMLRDSYKEGTQAKFNEIKAEVEKDCEKKTQQAEKSLTLLNHCHHTMELLDEQRNSIGKALAEHAEQAKLLTKRIRLENDQRREALKQNESAMWQLLNELRPKNT